MEYQPCKKKKITNLVLRILLSIIIVGELTRKSEESSKMSNLREETNIIFLDS